MKNGKITFFHTPTSCIIGVVFYLIYYYILGRYITENACIFYLKCLGKSLKIEINSQYFYVCKKIFQKENIRKVLNYLKNFKTFNVLKYI